MSLRSTDTLKLLLAFSLHFSSSSAFLRSLFTQSSHPSCVLPHFLQPSCFLVSYLFGDLSSFILTMCSAHFIRCVYYTFVPSSLYYDSQNSSFDAYRMTLVNNVTVYLQTMENLKANNQRLKEENGALIRVISKLSK